MKLYMISIAYLAADIINSAIAAPIARRGYLAFTNGDYTGITVGDPFAITWSGNSGAVTVNLKSRSVDNLQTLGTVASGIWGASAAWTPTTEGTYALEIIDASGNFNYSPQFRVGSGIVRCDIDSPTNADYAGIITGYPFTMAWASTTEPVTLTFLNGPATGVEPVFIIATSLKGRSHIWTPPAELVSDMYAFQISDLTRPINYPSRFWISRASISSRHSLEEKHTLAAHQAHDISMKTNKVVFRRSLDEAKAVDASKPISSWKDTALHPLKVLGNFFNSPFSSSAPATADLTLSSTDTPAPPSQDAPATFVQGDEWKAEKFRHGTWTKGKTVTRSAKPAVNFNGTPCWDIKDAVPDVCSDAQGKLYQSASEQAPEMKAETLRLAKEGRER